MSDPPGNIFKHSGQRGVRVSENRSEMVQKEVLTLKLSETHPGAPQKEILTPDSKLDQPWSSSKINLYPWPWVKLTLQLPTKKSFSNSQKEAPDSSSCWGALLLNIPKV